MNDKKIIHEEQADWVGEIAKDSQALANLQNQYNSERDLLNQLLGQAQMAESFAKFSLTVSTSKLAYVKEHKLYKALKGRKSADGQQFTGTWEEFCSLLNRSRQQVDEDIANLKSLGEEALESMSRMGIGYRELRQYRKLSDDQKTALIEVAKAGDKESFVELAEEIMVKHSREKESLNKQVAELKADTQAKDELLAKKNEKIDQLDAELTKRTQLTPDARLLERQEQERTALDTLYESSRSVLLAVQQFYCAVNDLNQFAAADIKIDDQINQTVHYVYQQIAQISVEQGIEVSFENVVNPPWMQAVVAEDN